MAYKSEAKRNSYKKKWRAANKDRVLNVDAKWIDKNRDKLNKRNRERYAANPHKKRAYHRQWSRDHREHEEIRRRKRNRQLKSEMISAYGGRCVCCGDTHPEFLTSDHIFGDGAKERRETRRAGAFLYCLLKRLGWPKDRYQLLCMNCNFSKGKFGYCPHEIERRALLMVENARG